MIDLMYKIIYWIAGIENKIISINDAGGYYFDDKQLHFIVIGGLGLLMIFITYPLFKLLAKHNHTMVISWIYVFTLLIAITFAIEIGQWLTGTGRMEMADATYGLAGFLVMFFIFAVIRAIFHFIVNAFKEDEGKH